MIDAGGELLPDGDEQEPADVTPALEIGVSEVVQDLGFTGVARQQLDDVSVDGAVGPMEGSDQGPALCLGALFGRGLGHVPEDQRDQCSDSEHPSPPQQQQRR